MESKSAIGKPASVIRYQYAAVTEVNRRESFGTAPQCLASLEAACKVACRPPTDLASDMEHPLGHVGPKGPSCPNTTIHPGSPTGSRVRRSASRAFQYAQYRF